MSKRQQTAIEEFEAKLWYRLCLQNDKDFLFSDLTGLYVEIINVISKTDRTQVTIIYDYAKLLEQELQLYSGMEAYIAGRESKNKPLNEVMNDYLYRVMVVKNEQRLDNRIQEYYDKISGLLGNNHGLIADFTEIYGAVHGMVKNHIQEFIHLGQAYSADITTES